MVEEKDIAGISIPFAAGTATGLVLCSFLNSSHAAAILFILFPLLILSTILVFRENHYRALEVAIIFLAAGTFCSISSHTAGQLSYTQNDQAVPKKALQRLEQEISTIPYPSETTAPLIQALLTGERKNLDKDVIQTFRKSGASHILALSGLHLGIIYLILTKILSVIGNTIPARRARYGITVCTSLFYVIMTGGSASLCRAFLFILLRETAKLLGRHTDPIRILLGAMTIQLAIKPEVFGTVSFQLSYSAMAGIFLLYPKLKGIYPESAHKQWRKIDPMKKIWDAATLSISCQVFTAPLAWHYFHTFPKYFIITNLIALPMTSAVMALSVATIALSFAGICPMFLISLNDKAVQTMIFCLQVISSM